MTVPRKDGVPLLTLVGACVACAQAVAVSRPPSCPRFGNTLMGRAVKGRLPVTQHRHAARKPSSASRGTQICDRVAEPGVLCLMRAVFALAARRRDTAVRQYVVLGESRKARVTASRMMRSPQNKKWSSAGNASRETPEAGAGHRRTSHDVLSLPVTCRRVCQFCR